MARQLFCEKIPKIVLTSLLEEVGTTSLFFLSSARNAWHSKCVEEYLDGGMYPNEQSAKDGAEGQRTKGTFFYISQLPALLFISTSGFLAVTEINTFQPLSGYSPDAVAKLRGATMLNVADSFQRSSGFWNRPPAQNSVIVVGTDETGTIFSPDANCRSNTVCSYSKGGNSPLGWQNDWQNDERRNISPKHVIAIAARFSS